MPTVVPPVAVVVARVVVAVAVPVVPVAAAVMLPVLVVRSVACKYLINIISTKWRNRAFDQVRTQQESSIVSINVKL